MEWLESAKNNADTWEKGRQRGDGWGGEGFLGEEEKKKHNRKQTSVSISAVSSSSSSSFQGSLVTVFLCELLGVLHEPGAIFAVLLRQVGPQRVLRLWTGH